MMRGRLERGMSAAMEFVVLIPMLLLLIGVVIAAMRIAWARSAVQALADSAARQTSIARTAGEGQARAVELVRRDVAASGLVCAGGVRVQVDASGFAVPVGQPATVGARIGCTVALADLLVPGLPGTITADAEARSTLDRYRGRK